MALAHVAVAPAARGGAGDRRAAGSTPSVGASTHGSLPAGHHRRRRSLQRTDSVVCEGTVTASAHIVTVRGGDGGGAGAGGVSTSPVRPTYAWSGGDAAGGDTTRRVEEPATMRGGDPTPGGGVPTLHDAPSALTLAPALSSPALVASASPLDAGGSVPTVTTLPGQAEGDAGGGGGRDGGFRITAHQAPGHASHITPPQDSAGHGQLLPPAVLLPVASSLLTTPASNTVPVTAREGAAATLAALAATRARAGVPLPPGHPTLAVPLSSASDALSGGNGGVVGVRSVPYTPASATAVSPTWSRLPPRHAAGAPASASAPPTAAPSAGTGGGGGDVVVATPTLPAAAAPAAVPPPQPWWAGWWCGGARAVATVGVAPPSSSSSGGGGGGASGDIDGSPQPRRQESGLMSARQFSRAGPGGVPLSAPR
jgi:hypothetical protein